MKAEVAEDGAGVLHVEAACCMTVLHVEAAENCKASVVASAIMCTI